MINVFSVIKDVYDASEEGKQIANPKTWANRGSAAIAIVALIQTAILLANEFLKTPITINDIDVKTIGEGVAIVGVFVANKLHVAANPNAGKKGSK